MKKTSSLRLALFAIISFLLMLVSQASAATVGTLSVPGSFTGGSCNVPTGTVTIVRGLADTGEVIVYMGSSGVSVPGYVGIPAGSSSANFSVASNQVYTQTAGTVTATTGDTNTVSAGTTVLPFHVSIGISPGTITGSESAQVTATVDQPSCTALVNMSATNGVPVCAGYGYLVIPAHQTSGSCQVGPAAVSSPLTVTISAYTGNTATTTIEILPDPVDTPANTPEPRCLWCEAHAGPPVNLSNGNVWVDQTDYSIPGIGGGLSLTRTWNSLLGASLQYLSPPVSPVGLFGHSWRTNFEESLQVTSEGLTRYRQWNGNIVTFSYVANTNTYTLAAPRNFQGSLTYSGATNQRTITFLSGDKKVFNSTGQLVAIVDRNGNATSLAYDAQNRLSTVTDAASRVLTFHYPDNSTSLVSSIQDSTGTIASYTYGSNSVLSSVTYADSSILNFAYSNSTCNPQGVPCTGQGPRLTSITDGLGKSLETHDYDAYNRGTSAAGPNDSDHITITYPSQTQTQLTDFANNVSTVNSTSGAGYMTVDSVTGTGCFSCGFSGPQSYTYDAYGNRTSLTDSAGHTSTWNYDGNSNVTAHTVPLDSGSTAQTSYTYNSLGEVLTSTDPMGKVTTNTYDSSGNLLSTQGPSPDGTAPGPITYFTYDSLGQLHTVQDPRGNITTINYNSVGLVSSITDPASATTSFGYDARGNRTSVTDAQSNTTTFTYDVMNRLTRVTQPDTTHTDFAYDYRGRRTSVTDANAKTTNYAYDDSDRLTSVTNAATHTTQYAYDPENSITSITDALNRVTSFAYDTQRRLTQTTFPSTLAETYTYDVVGNLITKTDRNNHTITYGYDFANRLKSKSYPDSTSVNYTYDLASRLTQATDPTGTYGMTYDNLGRLTGTSTQYSFLSGQTFNIAYGYDAASNRTSMTDPQSGGTTYAYDVLNRLITLTNPQSQAFNFGYDSLSRRTSLTRANGVNTNYAYDTLSRLLSVAHVRNGANQDGASYTLDNVGNRLTKTYLNSTFPGTATYSYDSTYQLTDAIQPCSQSGCSQGNSEWAYQYDAVGNSVSRAGQSETFNGSNELTAFQGYAYSYDNNGNLTSKNSTYASFSAVWDFENRLTSWFTPMSGGGGFTTTFKYDPFGRRIQKAPPSGSATNYIYDGANILEQIDNNGNVVAKYTQGAGVDEPLAMLRGGATYYYHADGLGTITTLTNSTGTRAAFYKYDPFGSYLIGNGVTNPYSFTGREYDSETGLYYYRARYYDPSVGRFLSQDPIGFSGGVDFYTYVSNHVTNYSDPTGLKQQTGPATPRYNCMAWGLGVTWAWITPSPGNSPNAVLPLFGCKNIDCKDHVNCHARAKVKVFEDSADSENWHVERQTCDKGWTSKYGQMPVYDHIEDPDVDYAAVYSPRGRVKKTCWSCPATPPMRLPDSPKITYH